MHIIDTRLWHTFQLHQYTGLLPVRTQLQMPRLEIIVSFVLFVVAQLNSFEAR